MGPSDGGGVFAGKGAQCAGGRANQTPLGTPYPHPTDLCPKGGYGQSDGAHPHTGGASLDLRTGSPMVKESVWPKSGEGIATAGRGRPIHPCSLQIAELTPNFGFRLKKNRRRSIYLFPHCKLQITPTLFAP
jgi:hypothetical protein